MELHWCHNLSHSPRPVVDLWAFLFLKFGRVLGQQVDRTFDLLTTKYMNYMITYQGLQRVETPTFPEDPLRECILNAVAHKDYQEQIPIQISVYPDRIVFWNPGELPESWTVDNLLKKHPSKAFNPAIANAFFRCGEVEAWGRGIGKIVNGAIAEKLLPPVFDTSFGGLMVTFFNSPAAQLKEAGIDDRGIAVVNYVLAEKKVTNSDVQKLLKVSKPTATRILSSLSDYLVITGTRGKGTYYSIKGLTIGSSNIRYKKSLMSIQFSLLNTLVAYMVTKSASFWIESLVL